MYDDYYKTKLIICVCTTRVVLDSHLFDLSFEKKGNFFCMAYNIVLIIIKLFQYLIIFILSFAIK